MAEKRNGRGKNKAKSVKSKKETTLQRRKKKKKSTGDNRWNGSDN